MIKVMEDVLAPVQPTIALLQKNSLTGAVQQEISRLIQSGELGPGDKLSEVVLAERLGVSRGPVREAFRVLEGDLQEAMKREIGAGQVAFERFVEMRYRGQRHNIRVPVAANADAARIRDYYKAFTNTAAIDAACARLTGPIEQVPPMHSALKKDGKCTCKNNKLEGVELRKSPPYLCDTMCGTLLAPGAVDGTSATRLPHKSRHDIH